MGSSSATFTGVGQALADRLGTEVIAVDLRGHGDSPEPPTDAAPDTPEYLELWRVEAMASDVLHLLRSRGGSGPVVVDVLGHSWGVKVACALTQLLRSDDAKSSDVAVRSVIIEDGTLEPWDRRPSVEATSAAVASAAALWRDTFESVEAANDFCRIAMNEPTRDYAKGGKIVPVGTSGPDEASSWRVLFRPHGDLAWHHHACRYDASALWDGTRFASPVCAVLAQPGAYLETDRRVLDADRRHAHANGRVRDIAVVRESGHSIHKTNPAEFVDIVTKFLLERVA